MSETSAFLNLADEQPARVVEGSKTWELYRTLSDEHQARLVGTLLIRLEAEYGISHSNFFLNQKERRADEQTKKE